MNLDSSQSLFLEKFKEELKIFKNDFFILTGAAGTGKTELIKESVEYCEEHDIGYQCLAFTGRAASVLRSRGLENTKTIDSWLHHLKKANIIEELEKYKKFVFFIDESSMISNSAILFEDEEPELDFKLDEIMWSTYGFMPCKDIIFVFAGDNNQLPPLKHDYCPALDADYLNKRYGIEGSVFTLEKVYRQSKESEISKIAKYFTSKTDNISLKIPSLKEIEDSVQVVQESDIVRLFFELYFKNKHDVKIITATNKKADYYNFKIKEKISTGTTGKYQPYLIPNSYLEPQVGDILQIFNNTGNIWGEPLYNGDFLEILKIGKVNESVLQKEHDDFIPFVNQELLVETITDDGEKTGLTQQVTISVDHLINSFQLTSKQFEYFDKKESGMLKKIKDYKSLKSKRIYFDKEYNPVLAKYGYAITGHKAQGGGWGNIIIDFSGFNDEEGHLPPSWIYTAITRAKSNLYIANYPDGKVNG
jgi:exodeoxyribonuclease-5